MSSNGDSADAGAALAAGLATLVFCNPLFIRGYVRHLMTHSYRNAFPRPPAPSSAAATTAHSNDRARLHEPAHQLQTHPMGQTLRDTVDPINTDTLDTVARAFLADVPRYFLMDSAKKTIPHELSFLVPDALAVASLKTLCGSESAAVTADNVAAYAIDLLGHISEFVKGPCAFDLVSLNKYVGASRNARPGMIPLTDELHFTSIWRDPSMSVPSYIIRNVPVLTDYMVRLSEKRSLLWASHDVVTRAWFDASCTQFKYTDELHRYYSSELLLLHYLKELALVVAAAPTAAAFYATREWFYQAVQLCAVARGAADMLDVSKPRYQRVEWGASYRGVRVAPMCWNEYVPYAKQSGGLSIVYIIEWLDELNGGLPWRIRTEGQTVTIVDKDIPVSVRDDTRRHGTLATDETMEEWIVKGKQSDWKIIAAGLNVFLRISFNAHLTFAVNDIATRFGEQSPVFCV